LQRIAAIYAIEARIRGASAEHRLQVRQSETQALFEALKPWLMDRLTEISTKSPLAKAIRYTLGHWAGLGVFLTDGRVEIDTESKPAEKVRAPSRSTILAPADKIARKLTPTRC
jgi:transposase